MGRGLFLAIDVQVLKELGRGQPLLQTLHLLWQGP